MKYLIFLVSLLIGIAGQAASALPVSIRTTETSPPSGWIPIGNGTNFIGGYITNGAGATVTFDGTNYVVSSSAGGGNVTAVGTPLNNQVGIWTSATGLEGDTDLTFDGTTLTATGFSGPLSGNATTANALSTGRTIAITGDLAYTSPSFDGSGNVTASGTLATVNSDVGSFGNGSYIPTITVNAKGLITSVTTNAVTAAGTGDVVGPGSSTDNAIVRFDLTTGKLIQNSIVTIDDSGNIAGINDFSIANLIVTNAIPVTSGGTGRSTSTTAYGLLAAGTTATGNQQTLAAGATTEILVGGGASALPVWTTATGSGSPVRGTSPGFTTAANPISNDGAALGTAALQWSDLFLAEGGVINFDNGDATVTQTANDITIAGISTFGVGTSTAVTLGTIELGAASDTTLSRVSAGVVAIEGNNIVTTATNNRYKYAPAGFVVDGGGSAVTTGKVKGFTTVRQAGTITAWNIAVDTGTCTVKVWKVATGTAVPTIANVINTSGVSISSGTYVRSTTVTDFTTTSVAANDILAYDITAVSGATEITFGLEITTQ